MKILNVLIICIICLTNSSIAFAECFDGDLRCKVEELEKLSSQYLATYKKLLESDLSDKEVLLELASDFDKIANDNEIKNTNTPEIILPITSNMDSKKNNKLEKNFVADKFLNSGEIDRYNFYFTDEINIENVYSLSIALNNKQKTFFTKRIDDIFLYYKKTKYKYFLDESIIYKNSAPNLSLRERYYGIELYNFIKTELKKANPNDLVIIDISLNTHYSSNGGISSEEIPDGHLSYLSEKISSDFNDYFFNAIDTIRSNNIIIIFNITPNIRHYSSSIQKEIDSKNLEITNKIKDKNKIALIYHEIDYMETTRRLNIFEKIKKNLHQEKNISKNFHYILNNTYGVIISGNDSILKSLILMGY